MTRLGLTKRQHEVLIFIRDYIAGHGYSPSITEICAGVGQRSRGKVHEYLTDLEKRGYIAKGRNVPRGVVLTDNSPEGHPGFVLPPDLDAMIRDGAEASGIDPIEMLTRILVRWRDSFTPHSVSRETRQPTLEAQP